MVYSHLKVANRWDGCFTGTEQQWGEQDKFQESRIEAGYAGGVDPFELGDALAAAMLVKWPDLNIRPVRMATQ